MACVKKHWKQDFDIAEALQSRIQTTDEEHTGPYKSSF